MKSLKPLFGAAAIMAVALASATPVEALNIANPYLVTDSGTYLDTGGSSVTLIDVDGNDDDATAFLMLEATTLNNLNTFGIYGYSHNGSSIVLGDMLQVFGGSNNPIGAATIEFDVLNGTATYNGVTKNIGTNFGFYISRNLNDPSQTFYSHQSLNLGGDDYALLFNVAGTNDSELFGSRAVIAFSDGYLGDFDYNDVVVGINDVTAVPEPGSMLLLGTGLFGLAGAARRKLRRA